MITSRAKAVLWQLRQISHVEHVNFYSEGEEDPATGPVIISFESKVKDKRMSPGAKAIVRMKHVY